MTRQGMESTTRRALAVAAALTLAALTLALAASSAGAAVPRSFWGVGSQTPLVQKDFDQMNKGKVGTIRIPVFWSEVDQTAEPGDTNWGSIDPIIAGAASGGVRVLPFLYGMPKWVATGLDGKNCQPAKCAIRPPKSPEALAAWETFVGEFIDRYGPQGAYWDEEYTTVPKVPIDVVQAWNEQNSNSFYAPKANPRKYAKLLGATADAVRARDDSIDVVLGGMPQLAGSKKAIKASEYLADLYKVAGVEDDFDGVAIHPYGASLQKVAGQVELFRDVIKKARDSKASLWITEVGAGSANGGNPLNRGRKGQADLLIDTFKYFRKNRNKFNIENVDWFSWMDNTVSFCDWCKSSGLFKVGLKAKPSWRAFTKFTGGR